MLPIWIICAAVLAPSPTSAFQLTINPRTYPEGEEVPLFVNKLFSDKTQLPYAYNELPFVCHPKSPEYKVLNLGEILRGDRLTASEHHLPLKNDLSCAKLCTVAVKRADLHFATELIKLDYRIDWVVDGLPAAVPQRITVDGERRKLYETGFPLGEYDETSGNSFLHNHVQFRILYQPVENSQTAESRSHNYIVGVEVFPTSILTNGTCFNDSDDLRSVPPLLIDHNGWKDAPESLEITYTYSVVWEEDKTLGWQNRWEPYVRSQSTDVHWYSIVNSLVILLFLSLIVFIIMLRSVNRDIAVYNEEDLKEEREDTTGWKLLHGDVFRAPRGAELLAPLVGSGVQFLLMVVVTIGCAMMGLLSPVYRGGAENNISQFVTNQLFSGLVHFSIVLFMFMGIFGGYYSARLSKTFKVKSWIRNATLTAALCPGAVMLVVVVLNFLSWSRGASNAIPFGTFFALGALWFGISLPLVLIGSYFGWKKPAIEHPVRTNQIPRQIPELSFYMRATFRVLMTGLIPFAVVFLELYFILKSVWNTDQTYYMFGFLGLVLLLLVLTSIEVTIVTIYFSLAAENYKWHWQSFFVSSASTVYVFAYSVYYYVHKLDIRDPISGMMYFATIVQGCFIYWLCTGTVGFLASYAFIIRMYSSIKIE
ncbi:hypothetical protein BJ742DRAFT_878507 [Cladochytrium replicatum]|nr:hypothetical protein BJ742DRAFT_878507 [Cladochytrium replicatum]